MVPKPNIPTIAGLIELTNEDSKPPDKPSDFEMAISATGHGLFHYLLLLSGLPCCMATLYETTTLSYVLPSADCDLHLTLTDKGILNGITYAGMIISAIPWGYLSDKLGRRKLLINGYLLDAFCVFMCALSQNVWTLIVSKFLGGLITCGPFAVLMSYLSEFHGAHHRAIVMMVIGIFFSSASVSLPALAWLIIPKPWTIQMGSYVSLKSWQIFLAISGFPSLISGVAMIFFPESPKFLMSQGRNEEALRAFQTIFRVNTGRSTADYPNVVNSTTYLNTIIVGCVGHGGYLIAGALINAVGSKNILIYGLCVAGSCGIGLFWAPNAMTTVALSSIYTTIGSISSTALIGIVVNLFPTSLRTMTISLVMMFGRFGALIDNVVFPYLLQWGCLPPFLLIGLVEFACSFLCMLLPKGNQSLQ